jgi:predicted ribosome quality control (RQC) complex YloA/Tae2 family protein
MHLKLFYEKSVHQNAAHYYGLAKGSREKAAGLEKAIAETRKELEKAEKEKQGGKKARVKRDREWYEQFHFSFTSGGRLLIGGRSAKQNDVLFAKHMDDADLFFHADIQGASAVILKGGTSAGENELLEAAQFAASFSKAWVNGNASVDVYAVKKSQLSKHATGGFIPSGAFAISGEREWFRSTRLALCMGLGEKGIALATELTARNANPGTSKLRNQLVLLPSRAGKEKGTLARSLAKRYGVHQDDLLALLPNGKTKTLETP